MPERGKVEERPAAAGRAGGDGSDVVERLRRIHRENELLFERLVDGEQRFRALARAVWEVQEQERRRVASELHDGLGQTLTALKMRLEGLGGRAAVSPELAAELGKTVDLASQALGEARRLAHLLRPQMLDDLGLYPALRWLGRTLGEWTGFEVRLDLVGDVPGVPPDGEGRLDPELETLAFRVVQEGLTNAMKHSGARQASVRVEHRDDGLRIEVTDSGRGFDPRAVLEASEAPAGFGLQGMRDRVELTGGRLELHSRPGEGARLVAELPSAPAGPGERRTG